MSKYLIVDFGASLNHTHHKQSIFAFCTLLRKVDINFDVWIPLGSEIESRDTRINTILLPGTHTCRLNIKKPSTWLSAVLGKLQNSASSYKFTTILSILTFIPALFFILLFKMKFRKNKMAIIFTTICPFSLRAIYLLEFFKIQVDIYCRVTNTSEIRGTLARIIPLNSFIEKSKNFKFVRLYFGFETQALLSTYKNKLEKNLFISKFPSEQKFEAKEISDNNHTISFLGFPTKNKGHDMIKSIIKRVGKVRPNYTWQVQLYEDDPLLSQLNQLNLEITTITGKISSDLMVGFLAKSTVICLPYDVVAFKLNASAMMYEATDHLVPIITFSGSAFSADIDDFGCGLTAKNEDEMVSHLINMKSGLVNEWIKGCSTYNEYRNKSNLYFLNAHLVNQKIFYDK